MLVAPWDTMVLPNLHGRAMFFECDVLILVIGEGVIAC
jgi:hypothetical protein